MIRFDLVRVKMTSLGLAALLTGSMIMVAPQASFATDWMDLLKPLVTNVIVPGASLGMKKFIQHEEKIHPELVGKLGENASSSSASSFTSNTSVTGSVTTGMEQFFDNSATSSASATSSTASFASPEEPISSNSEGSAGSAYWAASHSVSATDPAPAPPPPVATP